MLLKEECDCRKASSSGSSCSVEGATTEALRATWRNDGLAMALSRVSLGWKFMPRTQILRVLLTVSGEMSASVPIDRRKRPIDERLTSLPSCIMVANTSARSSRTFVTTPLDSPLWAAILSANSASPTTSALTIRGNN